VILVTGANGRTGGAVVTELASRGAAVRALVYEPDGPLDPVPAGVEVVEGDYDRPDSLDAALGGVERMFLVTTGSPSLVRHETNAILAARRSGVRHVVKLSALGAGVAPFAITQWHAETERKLRGSGIEWTFLRPNFFMQNFLVMFDDRIAAEGSFSASAGEGKISMVDYRDIALVAAAALTSDGHARRIHVVTGPEALSFAEAAARMSTVLGRQIRYVDLPSDQLRRDLVAHGVRPPFAETLLGLFAFFRAGHGALVTDTVATVGGRQPRTFDQFLVEAAPAFAAPVSG
jgi:uncharacterized protein YbjT (DUF2867 family)